MDGMGYWKICNIKLIMARFKLDEQQAIPVIPPVAAKGVIGP